MTFDLVIFSEADLKRTDIMHNSLALFGQQVKSTAIRNPLSTYSSWLGFCLFSSTSQKATSTVPVAHAFSVPGTPLAPKITSLRTALLSMGGRILELLRRGIEF
jgi:hypothetical protein